jgi:hypothetical protein
MHLGLKRNRPFVPQSSFMGALKHQMAPRFWLLNLNTPREILEDLRE